MLPSGRCFGMFSSLDILLGVRAVSKDGNALFFNTSQEANLECTTLEDEVMEWASQKRVRVIAHVESEWLIDPCVSKFKLDWDI